MPNNDPHSPRSVPQVMVSSTFSDLKDHRTAINQAINKHKLHPNVMEHDDAKLKDVIDSSLQMVRDSAAYILIIGLKYGQTPECPDRNPNQLSITELEFNEALGLNRPILLFIMGEDHPVKKADIERDTTKENKLNEFREQAKQMSSDSTVHRVYSVFNSLEEFKEKFGSSIAELRRFLDAQASGEETLPAAAAAAGPTVNADSIPPPPAFYAEPDYIGSHKFVGRARELEELSDWAKPADPTNLLLFEAIGGNGKSMLTWEWATNHAPYVRAEKETAWAGRFWYSFYERGAIMADFCQRALAYMTGQPLSELRKKKTAELKEPLLAQLHSKPWLLILDGLERVLVAYHHIDAAEMRDEEANSPKDKIVDRNPIDAIRDEDNDLLRALAAARPSKILVSSRLTPRVLLNSSGQPINGAKRITLPGLRPADAERLLRSCGIEGDSGAIQSYLSTNCDNHPLVIGILGGLIRNYLPKRGNFDTWAADSNGGAKLDLAKLDLIQRRNHILRAALDDLSPASRQLLSTLALLSESVDYETLAAFNPHLPPEPEEVKKPRSPKIQLRWDESTDRERAKMLEKYEAALERYQEYEKAVQARLNSKKYRVAPQKLTETVTDLEQRGLLQYDDRIQRYDLHPVVRGVAAGGMQEEDKQRYGLRVVDHFSSLPHNPYDQAETLEDLRPGLNVVRTLLKLGHFQQAADAYLIDLGIALESNVDAYAETLSLLRPFFPGGWGELPTGIKDGRACALTNNAGNALLGCGESIGALAAYTAALRDSLERNDRERIFYPLFNIPESLHAQGLLSSSIRVSTLSLDMAIMDSEKHRIFAGRLQLFFLQSLLGQWVEAESTWQLLDPMGRDWPRGIYLPGRAEYNFARFHYYRGTFEEEFLAIAERLAAEGNNRRILRYVHELRGYWRLDQEEWALAATSFAEAVRMTRESGIADEESETGLALAKHRLGELIEPQLEAERLAELRKPEHRLLAELWLAIGNQEQAEHHGLAAYKWAWADGEPYVYRYELTKTTELLERMNVPIPKLPDYDPDKDEPFPWEADVRAAIEKLRAEKETKEQAKKEAEDSNE